MLKKSFNFKGNSVCPPNFDSWEDKRSAKNSLIYLNGRENLNVKYILKKINIFSQLLIFNLKDEIEFY